MRCVVLVAILALAVVGLVCAVAHSQTSGCMPTNCPPPKCEGGRCR
jgi:hypothetical protein